MDTSQMGQMSSGGQHRRVCSEMYCPKNRESASISQTSGFYCESTCYQRIPNGKPAAFSDWLLTSLRTPSFYCDPFHGWHVSQSRISTRQNKQGRTSFFSQKICNEIYMKQPNSWAEKSYFIIGNWGSCRTCLDSESRQGWLQRDVNR